MDKPIRYGVRVGHGADGWRAEIGRHTLSGATGRSMSGGTFWDVVKFFAIPTRYYIWRYKRERKASRG